MTCHGDDPLPDLEPNRQLIRFDQLDKLKNDEIEAENSNILSGYNGNDIQGCLIRQ